MSETTTTTTTTSNRRLTQACPLFFVVSPLLRDGPLAGSPGLVLPSGGKGDDCVLPGGMTKSIAQAVAVATHHSALRRQKTAHCRGHVRRSTEPDDQCGRGYRVLLSVRWKNSGARGLTGSTDRGTDCRLHAHRAVA